MWVCVWHALLCLLFLQSCSPSHCWLERSTKSSKLSYWSAAGIGVMEIPFVSYGFGGRGWVSLLAWFSWHTKGHLKHQVRAIFKTWVGAKKCFLTMPMTASRSQLCCIGLLWNGQETELLNYVAFYFAAIKTMATSCLGFLQTSVITLSLKRINQTLLRAASNGITGIL